MSDQSFLGTGWGFPPTFLAQGGDVVMTTGVEDIHQSLQILLATELKERVMAEDFGCALGGVLFEEISQSTVNRVTSLIKDAILNHESRIKLEKIDVSDDKAIEGLLSIRLDYTVKSTNSRFNMVYPFYLQEANTPGL